MSAVLHERAAAYHALRCIWGKVHNSASRTIPIPISARSYAAQRGSHPLFLAYKPTEREIVSHCDTYRSMLRIMAELDYAFLAERAQIESGRLFVMGGSFTHMTVPELPASMTASIAGRVRVQVGEPSSDIEISLVAPEQSYTLQITGSLGDDSNSRHYGDNRLGRLFALNFEVPLIAEGLYKIAIKVNDIEVRKLAFTVEVSAG